jgi:hypothetical protein
LPTNDVNFDPIERRSGRATKTARDARHPLLNWTAFPVADSLTHPASGYDESTWIENRISTHAP